MYWGHNRNTNIRVLVATTLLLDGFVTAATAMSVVNEGNKAEPLKITPQGSKQIHPELIAKAETPSFQQLDRNVMIKDTAFKM